MHSNAAVLRTLDMLTDEAKVFRRERDDDERKEIARHEIGHLVERVFVAKEISKANVE